MRRVVSFEPPSLPALLCITRELRAQDRAECLCQAFDTPEALARGTLAAGGLQWVVWLNDLPVASLGAAPVLPGLWSAWFYATDEWLAAAGDTHRWVCRVLRPALLRLGARRVECLSLAGHDTAHRWLRALGAREEGTLRQRGRNGEDFVMFAWTRDPDPVPNQQEAEHVQPA